MNKIIDELIATHMQIGQLFAKQSKTSVEEKIATRLQYISLRLIKLNKDKLTIKNLSEELSLSISSATQLIERLDHAGYIEKISDKNDKRVTRLKLTKIGEKEFNGMSIRMKEKIKNIFSEIPKEDILHLVRINKNILKGIKIK